ncbi:MAG: hypothetical protein Ct9H90mP30_3840 [Actinomycetota bacterium]|nr:MAG: hypothetical protein Ct9H90mP30_3840 [Actinomycetota bacterium]
MKEKVEEDDRPGPTHGAAGIVSSDEILRRCILLVAVCEI